MSLDERNNGNTPPVVLAGFACLVCLPLIHLALLPLAGFVHFQWAVWLLFTLIPIAAAFITLYWSPWHAEFSKVRRIISGVLSSCVIYIVGLLVAGMLAIGGCVILGLIRVVGGN